MSEPSPLRFGVFELDVRTGELRKHGVRLKIQDQPFQVLQVLLERPGELVTREELQNRIWAHDTFVDFDQSLNRAVNKVRDVLSDTAGTPRFIETLPRRGYRFIAPVEAAEESKPAEAAAQPEPPPQTANVSRSYKKLGWVAACFLVIAGAGMWLARDRGALPPPRVVALTTLTGREGSPAFSPDGQQLAFIWNGERQDNFDIYVKVVGDETPSRLTSDPADDLLPAWSPDGRHIAFMSMREGGGIYLVSPLTGPQRKLAGLATNSRPSWSADGKFLLVAQQHLESKPEPGDGALFLVPVASADDPRQVLAAPPGTWYRDPAYAPDGRSVAFLSCTGSATVPTCTLQIAGLKDGLVPWGKPRPIQQMGHSFGVAWVADGSSLIYGGPDSYDRYLWRVGVKSGKETQRLDLAGVGAGFPAVDFEAGRLAFSRTIFNEDIWRLERNGKPSPLLTSSLLDGSPQYSPDGRRIAFASGRRGEDIALWVANADGTELNQITRIARPFCGTPRWSPKGGSIAFDCLEKGRGWDVWVVEADGSSPRQLTHGPADNIIPSWSQNGESIYFASKRTGRFEIWRAPAHSGTEEQITRNGGYVAFDSTDGKTLYYTVSEAGTEGLYAKRLPDGDEKQTIKAEVAARGFAVFSDGLYYLYRRGPGSYEIRFHKFASGRFQIVGEIEGSISGGSGLAVSPDQKTFLFTKVVAQGSDLMMIENFR